MVSSNTIGIEEVSDDEFFQFFSGDFPIAVFINDLHVRSDVSGSWLETLVHCSITVYKPFSHLDGLTNSISVSVISFDDFSI